MINSVARILINVLNEFGKSQDEFSDFGWQLSKFDGGEDARDVISKLAISQHCIDELCVALMSDDNALKYLVQDLLLNDPTVIKEAVREYDEVADETNQEV